MRAAVAIMVLAVASPSLAGPSGSTAMGEASATVVEPLTLTARAELDFGTIATSNLGGTVVLHPFNPAPEYGGGVMNVCSAPCLAAHPAGFDVQGEAGRSYQIAYPQSLMVTPLPVASGGNGVPTPMLVDAITVKTLSRPDAGARGLLDEAGKDRFEVGGTLHVSANQAEARYATQLMVNISYF